MPRSIRRYYYAKGVRYHHDFPLEDLYELDDQVGGFQIVDTPMTEDINGNPTRYVYLSEEEIDFVLAATFRDLVDGIMALSINNIRGSSLEIQKHAERRLRVFIREEMRRTAFPNSVRDLLEIAQYNAYRYHRALMPAQQLVGFSVSDAMVETQGVISSIHETGDKMSSLQSIQHTASLVKGNTRNASDLLIFNKGKMNPYRAVYYNRVYSEVKLSDVFVRAHPDTLDTSKPLIAWMLRKIRKPAEAFCGHMMVVDVDSDKLAWHRLTLEGVAQRLRPYIEEEIVIPGSQSEGRLYILVPVKDKLEPTLLLKSFELNVLMKILLKVPLTKGVRGISSYKSATKNNTTFVVKEIARQVKGDTMEFLWHIHRQEMELLHGDDNPLEELLCQIDPRSSFVWMDTGVAEEPYSHQALITVHKTALDSANGHLIQMRERNKTRFVERGMRVMGYSEEEALARVVAKQLDYKFTPKNIINAIGSAFALEENMDALAEYDALATVDVVSTLDFLEGRHQFAETGDGSTFLELYRHTALLTTGSNYPENVRILPDIDQYLSIPLAPNDVYKHMGIEAARLTMLLTLIHNFCEAGKRAATVHMELPCDVMTVDGHIKKLDNIEDSEESCATMHKASRGRAVSIVRNASMNEDVDRVPGLLLSHMCGTRVMAGTGGQGIVNT